MIERLASVLALLVVLVLPAAQAQQFGAAQFPLKDDDGVPISNHGLSADQMAQVARLPGLVTVGNPDGDVTLYQFYDLNCPFCREAAADIDELMRADARLRVVFVPYPVLSQQSIEGARVELALREIAAPQAFLDFHRRIYAGRGIIDAVRALAVIRDMGIDQQQIITLANSERVTDTMKIHARLGGELRLMATPAYVIQGVAILGHPGLDPLREAVRSVRACRKVVC